MELGVLTLIGLEACLRIVVVVKHETEIAFQTGGSYSRTYLLITIEASLMLGLALR